MQNLSIGNFIAILGVSLTLGGDLPAQESSKTQIFDIHEVQGVAVNFLQPSLTIQNYSTNWSIGLDYLAQTNFPQNAWLRITNRVASKLELWTSDGLKVASHNPDTLDVFQLPKETTVSEIMNGVQQRWRVRQWLLFGVNANGNYATLNHSATVPGFDLGTAFNLLMTNDYTLKVTPLLYKVDTNLQSAHLTEFPPIKLKLHANGQVEQISD